VDLLEKLIDEKQPDVIFSTSSGFKSLIEQQRLLILDPLLKKHHINLEEAHPPFVDWLRDQGDGTIFGLSPSFQTNALFYNVDVFEKQGITLPHNNMSWDEVLHLANLFTTAHDDNAKLYGLYANGSALSLIESIAQTYQLSAWNRGTKKVTMNSDAWHSVYDSVIKAVQEGSVLVQDGSEQMTPYQRFVDGQIAMLVGGRSTFEALSTAQDLEWVVVTQPVQSAQSQSGTLNVPYIYSLNKDLADADIGLTFMEFIWNKYKVRGSAATNDLPIRSLSKESELSPFYALDYQHSNLISYNDQSMSFLEPFSVLKSEQIQLAIQGKISVSEALTAIQEEGQQLMELYFIE
jgi:multiple sugar transport system substrate-binding protein